MSALCIGASDDLMRWRSCPLAACGHRVLAVLTSLILRTAHMSIATISIGQPNVAFGHNK